MFWIIAGIVAVLIVGLILAKMFWILVGIVIVLITVFILAKTYQWEEKERKKFWRQSSFWGWMVTAEIIALIVPIVIVGVLPGVPWLIGVAEFLTLLLLLLWFKDNLRQVGTIKVPSQAVVARFAKPVDVVPTGLYFVFGPFEDLKEFPTGQYTMDFAVLRGLYTLEDKKQGLVSQPIEVEANVYIRWPRYDREYSFPRLIERIIEEKKKKGEVVSEKGLDTEGLKKGWAWGKKTGKLLLMQQTYPRLPVKDLTKPNVEDELGAHFQGGVMGGIRHVMQAKTSKQCREEQPVIETGIKNYLLSEEGNPFFECGIPRECLDIELTRVQLPKDMEEAYKRPEIKRKDAEAAKHEKKAIMSRLEAYIEKGTPEEIAALVVGGVEGRGMTMEQLRDLKILEALGGFGKTSSRDRQFARRRFSKRDLKAALKKLSTAELKEIVKEIK